MGMTFSTGDGEALNAVRLANRMLEAEQMTWAEVLHGPKLAPTPDYRTPPSKRGSAWGARAPRPSPRDFTKRTDDDIGPMFDAVGERRYDVSTLMFIASLRDFWERLSYLTDDQYAALKRIYANERGSGGFSQW
jgi:hypothetical protein